MYEEQMKQRTFVGIAGDAGKYPGDRYGDAAAAQQNQLRAGAPVDITPLQQELNRLGIQLAQLRNAVEYLTDRLRPVLGDVAPSTKSGQALDTQPVSPLCAQIREAANSAGWASSALEDLSARLVV